MLESDGVAHMQHWLVIVTFCAGRIYRYTASLMSSLSADDDGNIADGNKTRVCTWNSGC